MNEAASKLKIGIIIVLLAGFIIFSFIIAIFSYNSEHEGQRRSSSLKEITEEDGNVTTTRYEDENGTAQIAANLGYAIKKCTTDGNTVLEEYFDEKGDKVKQSSGHFAVLREYNELQQLVRLTYLDEEGRPMVIDSGYAWVTRTYDPEGKTESEYCFGIDGEPVDTEYNGYGRHFSYNENGYDLVIRYVDISDMPEITGQNFAVLKQKNYRSGPDEGRAEYVFFFDEKEQPLAQRDVIFGQRREYDEFGRISILTYVDADGNPVMSPDGMVMSKRTFYEDDSIRTEMYYDAEGKPARLKDGQYGILREDEKVTYLDIDGKEIFNLKNYLYNQPLSVIVAALIVLIISLLSGKRINLILLILYICVILYMTVYRRAQSSESINFELFWSYREFFKEPGMRKDIMDNIWLFVPLGTILYRLFEKRIVLLIPVAFSILIELVQFISGRGLAETDDVISNGLGGVIGVGIAYVAIYFMKKKIKDQHPAATDDLNS